MHLPAQLEKADQRMVLRALGAGVIAGMRSWTPPAAVALSYDNAPADAKWKSWPIFSSRLARLTWVFFGVNEYVADKWARTIPRIQLKPQMTHTDGGILGRSGVAALAGAAIGSEDKQENSEALGAAIAFGTSVVTNYLFYFLRKVIGEKSKVHDYTVAMIEDQLCVATAVAVARS
jgi:uncharacterized membrane protein